MSEEKKELNKKEMTEEELNKVAGGWTAKDTAKYNELSRLWERTMALAFSALNNAKESGDPVAIQKAQELYNKVVYDENLRKLYNLVFNYSRGDNCVELDKFWTTFDYQYYKDWLYGIATDLLGKV